MGVKISKKSKIIKINRKKEQESYPLMSNSFEFKYIIGRGGFGKVWKVVHKKTGVLYALKQMSKAKIIEKKSERAIKYERDLLVKIHHPFIVNMHYAFQDKDNLYLVKHSDNSPPFAYSVTIYNLVFLSFKKYSSNLIIFW